MLIGQGKENFIELLTSEPDMPFYEHKKQIGEFSELYMFAEKFGWTPSQVRDLYDNDWDTYMQFKVFLAGMAEGQETSNKK